MKNLLSALLPSEEKMKPLSRAGKIDYLNRWLTRVRWLVYAPILPVGILCIYLLQNLSYNYTTFAIITLIGLFNAIPLIVIVLLVSRYRLKSCIRSITEQEWTDKEDIPLLLGILNNPLHIPGTLNWAEQQLGKCALLHKSELADSERQSILRRFGYRLKRFCEITVQDEFYKKTLVSLPAILEVTGDLGGHAELVLLRKVKARAENLKSPAELFAAIENSLTRLEARIARQDAPEVLLRAGQAPADNSLLRAATAQPTAPPEELLRAVNAPRERS